MSQDVGIPSATKGRTCKSIRYITGKIITRKKVEEDLNEEILIYKENVTKIGSRISGEDLMRVQQAISNHFLFYTLSEELRLALI